MDINTITLTGRATKDVELKTTKSDKEVANFSIAVNGRKEDEVSFFDITVFGKTAEIASKYVTKGKQVAIVGRLHQSRWEDSEGAKRYSVGIVASQLKLLGNKSDGSGEKQATNEPEVRDNIPTDVDYEEISL